MAKDANDAGDIFPIYGICLGFETMHIMIANRTREDLLVSCTGQESVANTIELTRAAKDSIFFRRWTVSARILLVHPPLYILHNDFCILTNDKASTAVLRRMVLYRKSLGQTCFPHSMLMNGRCLSQPTEILLR